MRYERLGRQSGSLTPAGYGAPNDGFIGSLPPPNAPADSWAQFYLSQRIVPYMAALSASEHAGHRETDVAMLRLFCGGYGARAAAAARDALSVAA